MSTKHGSFVTHAWELESLITNPALTFQDIMINEPKIATLDLGLAMQSVSDISLKSVIETLNGAKSHHWPLQIVVKGVKSLFLVARNSGQTMEGLLKALVEANVTTIESSSYEAEDDLTISEVVQTHKAIHQCDIQSVAKVELQASYNGTALAFWRSFVQRLMAIIRLQSSSHGLVGIKVEAAKGSRISPAEYLRAVAVARILSHNISNVICPFVKIPSLAHSMDPDKAVRSRDTLKLAPICLFFGANDLDYVRLDSVNTRLISGELQKSGFVTVLRDARFNLTSSSSPGPGVDFTG